MGALLGFWTLMCSSYGRAKSDWQPTFACLTFLASVLNQIYSAFHFFVQDIVERSGAEDLLAECEALSDGGISLAYQAMVSSYYLAASELLACMGFGWAMICVL